MEHIFGFFVEPIFYARLLGGLAIWYALSCWIARLMFNGGKDPLRAARSGPLLALLLALPIVGIGAWFWWGSILLAGVLSGFTLAFALIIFFVLTRLEPTLEQ